MSDAACSVHGTHYSGFCEECVRIGRSAAKPRITHRVELVLGVQADDDEEAGKIAEAFYERFAKQVREVEGVLWLLPVANIKPKERGDAVL